MTCKQSKFASERTARKLVLSENIVFVMRGSCIQSQPRTRTFPVEEHLAEAEVTMADVLHVVFLQRPLDHLRRVVLAGQLQTGQNQGQSFYTTLL